MIKKILFSIGVLFSFLLMFLFVFDKINVLAYSDIGNALGSYPVKLDVDNYNRDNLLNLPDKQGTERNLDYTINGGVITLNGTTNSEGNVIIINNLNLKLNGGVTYNYRGFYESIGSITGTTLFIGSGEWTSEIMFVIGNNNLQDFTPSNDITLNYLRIYVGNNQTYNNLVIKPVISINSNIENFSPYFKFGYNVNYSLSVNNLTSTQVNAGIAITDSNGNYLKTGNCIIPASSSSLCHNLNDSLYLPFNIDSSGNVSFDYSLGLFIGPVGNLSVSPNDSGFNFVPVFNAYYKGSPTDNLYFKDRYTFNNLFLSGFNVSVNSSSLSQVLFLRNQVDSEYSMNTNKLVNFATDKKIETGIYNYINYIDFINSNPSDIYSFVVTAGVSSPVLLQDRIFTISFSNLSLKVNGDSGNSSPLPINPNTINKYNECSAWYDIPCQLGNGLTYVIYEAPIISPVLTFIVSFITMFSSLVSFVDLFRSFGIVFGCFVIYMFINLLHKYSK